MSNPDDIINVAEAEVGYHEGRDADGDWNNIQKYSEQVPGLGWSDGQPWCATFVSWCALQAGAADLFPRTASCATGLQWFRDRGRSSDYPAIGAQVFYGAGGGSHTGIVYAYDSNYLFTVEGNTNATGSAEGDGVYYKKRARRDSYVYAYGYPAYSGGIVSADPSWGGTGSAGGQPRVVVVSLARVREAARKDAPAPGTPMAYRDGVLVVERALAAEGLLDSRYVDGSFGTRTISAYAAWQRRLGYGGSDADGIPGHDSLARLGSAHGFRVGA